MILSIASIQFGNEIITFQTQIAMNSHQDKQSQNHDKILQKMFIYADNKDLNLNRLRNLIVNPQILRVLIHEIDMLETQEKVGIVEKVVDVYRKNSLNVCILLKRDREILEFNHSIFDEIVNFLFSVKVDFAANVEYFQKIRPLISGYPIGCRNIKNIVNKISKNFHSEVFNVQKLQLCLLLLKEIYKSQTISLTEPKCFFYMYGPNSGLRLINQDLKWTLAKGMHFYVGFYMESYKHQEMNLLNIMVNNDSFQLSIDQQNYLTVKVFQGAKINKLRKMEQKKWYFIKMAYCLRTGIIRNTYQLVIYIEGEPYELKDLPVPNTTIQNSIDQLIIGHQFYGKINIAAISRKEIQFWPKTGINNWGQLQGLLAANKDNLKDIFLLYSPLISSRISQNDIIFQISSKNHGQILENTAIHNNPFDQVDINYYGGLYTLVPFFYILKFYKHGPYARALQQMLDLILTVFKCGYQNTQSEAINCQMFGIIAQFVNQIDEKYITMDVVNIIGELKDCIELKPLRKQFLQNFLLKIRIDRLEDVKVIEKIHTMIASFYFKEFSWSLETASLYDLIWYIIDNFEPERKQECCLLHCWEQSPSGLEDAQIYDIGEHYKTKCDNMKDLIKFIVKSLCSNRKYDLLLHKNKEGEEVINSMRKKQSFSIFEYLKYDGYSTCLKKILLQCIQIGVVEDPHTLINDTELLECLFGLLTVSELKDQIVPVISVLNQCSKSLVLVKDPRNLEIIRHIGMQMDTLYIKKYASIRLRSKSDGIPINKKLSERKVTNEMQDNLSHKSEKQQKQREKQKIIKNKILILKKQRNIKISNDQQLYDLLISICCMKEPQSGDIMLIDDDCTKIINPYFKICAPKFKVRIIEIIRTTVLVRSKVQSIPPRMEGLAKFDQIYRFILSQFILKELDPDDPEYKPSEQSNYIIKNFFYILDHMVISRKNDWDSLYLFILRMIGVLSQAKKDIHKKTERSKEDILMACKVCVRKFVLRVLKYGQKSIENMGNMVFLVYVVVFNNPEPILHDSQRLFDYFQSLESNFFLAPIVIKNQDEHQYIDKCIFVDQKIIFAYFDGFKTQEVFEKQNIEPSKKRRYNINLIQKYLDKDQTNQLQDYLFKLRKVFLSKSQFKDILNEESKGIRKMISKFMIGSEQKKDSNTTYDLHVCQIIGLLLCLTVESSLISHRFQVLQQSLQKQILFIKAFSLSCSRDNLHKKEHQFRNQKLPTKIVYHIIHFLYEMMQRADDGIDQRYKDLIRQSIHQILTFITLIMTVLTEKVGAPTTIQDVLMLSSIRQDVQLCNYFTFAVLKGVITLNQIRVYSTIAKEKAFGVIEHENMKEHFKLSPTVFLEKHVKQAVEIHKTNIENIEKELQEKFEKDQMKRKSSYFQKMMSDSLEFEEYRLDHARKIDYEYRQTMRVWRKIWKRLRLYHYYWSISMDQRQEMKLEWQKFKFLPYKHKFGKYTHLDGLRPILQIEPNEPWHVKKAQLDEEVKYRGKNFMVNLYKLNSQKNVKAKSFIDILLLRKTVATEYFQVQWIKHNSKRKGRLSLTKQKLIFQYESTFQKDSHMDFTSFTLGEHRTIEKTWYLVNIVNIIKRRYLMREECLLIQFQDSYSVIFDFLNDDTGIFLTKIEQIQSQKSEMINFLKANKVAFYLKKFKRNNYEQQIQEATEEWNQGKITNLQYMMILNKYSGRSYLDPVNYPVMPWIIANYQFKEIVYRDLAKTLGALGSQSRRQFYEHKVETTDPFNSVPPYQYGTHYSSPGVLFNFFIRVSPYTEAGRTLQGGKFDLSDRLFSSVKICWHSVCNQVSDVRELNPQFFYLPQFLLNIDNQDFGLTQLKQRIDNVKLPLWAPNAYDFITTHRRALQSDDVSSTIQNWIDLVFGYKQKGKIAKDNLNLYYYLTYQNSIDLKKIEEPVQRISIEAQIIHFGQTPSQIFVKPHPARKFLKSSRPYSEAQKVKFLGLIQSREPILLLGEIDNNLLILSNSSLVTAQVYPNFQIKSELSLLRNTSKEGLYFIEDISNYGKVVLFGNNRFVAICSYVNGDLLIYNLSSKKLHQKKGTPKTFMIVNKKQNLLLCGCKNGLLQVYQIVYAQKQSVNLIKIISQYFMFPIEHISQGADFFSISSGNLVVINKITRGLNYINDKIKMQGTKMIRSFECKRKVQGSYICSNPLYCVVFYNALQVYIYSINGQFLKLRHIENIVSPILMLDCLLRENIVVLEPSRVLVLKVPELETVCCIPIPSKEYVDMRMVRDKLYLVTNNGEILYLFNQKQVMFY